MRDKVGLVHQMPFVSDRPGLPSTLEQVRDCMKCKANALHMYQWVFYTNVAMAMAKVKYWLQELIGERGENWNCRFFPHFCMISGEKIFPFQITKRCRNLALPNFWACLHHYVCMTLALQWRRPKGNELAVRKEEGIEMRDRIAASKKFAKNAFCSCELCRRRRRRKEPEFFTGRGGRTSAFPAHELCRISHSQ